VVKQIRVVDLIVLAGIALVLGAQDKLGHVPLNRATWYVIAGLLGFIAVAVAIRRYWIWLDSLPTGWRARAKQSRQP
jgi:hypothetical protein